MVRELSHKIVASDLSNKMVAGQLLSYICPCAKIELSAFDIL